GVLVVVELHAEHHDAERDAGDLRVGIREVRRAAMLRNLRQELADERRVRQTAIGDRRLIVEIATRNLPRRADAVFEIALHAPDARAAEILPLLRDVGTDL